MSNKDLIEHALKLVDEIEAQLRDQTVENLKTLDFQLQNNSNRKAIHTLAQARTMIIGQLNLCLKCPKCKLEKCQRYQQTMEFITKKLREVT